MNREHGPRRDDQAYSVVLGSMIMLGMVMVAFTTYQTSLAPGLEERAEADKMQEASDSLSAWTAAMGQARTDGTTSGTRALVPLAHGAPPFAGPSTSSTIRLDPFGQQVRLDADEMTISRLNGTLLGGTQEAWRSAENATVGSISEVTSFRLRLEEIDSSGTGESVTVDVEDASGERVGRMRVALEDPSSGNQGGGQGFELVVRTENAEGDVLHDQPILISSTTHDSQGDPIAPYWVNVLNEDYRFDRVLADAEAPFDVKLAEDGLDADYTIDHVQTDGASAGTTGLTVEGFNRSLEGGTLSFEGRAGHAEDQSLTVEHGALVRSQAEGAVFAKEPAVAVTVIDHVVHVSFTWPRLGGQIDAISASSTVPVHGTPSDVYALTGSATNLTVNLTSEHPTLWERSLQRQLEDAGLEEGRGFATATDSGWVRADVWGLLEPAVDGDRHDVRLEVRSPAIDVRIGS